METTRIEELKPYEFREFKATDIFLMTKLLSKIGFKDFKGAFESDEVKAAIEKGNEEGKNGAELAEYIQTDVLLGILDVLLTNIDNCQNELFKMLSAVSNLTENEVKNLSLANFTEMIADFIMKEDFEDFIKVVSKFFK